MLAWAAGASVTAAAINGMLSVNDFTSCPFRSSHRDLGRLNISRLIADLLGIAKLSAAGANVQSMTAASLRSVIGRASSCSSQIR